MPKRTSGWYLLALALYLVGLAGFAKYHDLGGLYVGYQYSEGEVRDLEERLESLKAERALLSSSVQGLGSDPLEMEAAIRASKGLVRAGETVYRIELPDDYAP